MNQDFNRGRRFERRESLDQVNFLIGIEDDGELRERLEAWAQELNQ
jgi:hypothetical protein